MRSYYAHLATTAPDAGGAISPKPTFRSSAIFPVFQTAEISSRILFLGYWLLKRNIQQISSVVSLRALTGELLARRNLVITEAKSFSVELRELLERAGLPADQPFTGSLEIEFYSIHNLVFPYPAVVINYYGPNFSAVVHTAQRVYNDYDDLMKNSQTQVPESGFSLYADDRCEPLISVINGAVPVDEGQMQFEFFNAGGEKLACTKELGRLSPYETIVLHPAKEFGLQTFFQGKAGYCKVQFNVNWIFPRLLVGNICRQPEALSITHTYYDCVQAVSDTDYWALPAPEWYPATLMVPVACAGTHFTNITFYPIYSVSTLAIAIEIYSSEGVLLGRKPEALIVRSPAPQMHLLRFKELLKELGIPETEKLAARVIATPVEGSRIPARIKLGLDLGNAEQALPCNICTNLQPFNPRLEGKQNSFKWAPLLTDQPAPTLWLMNSSPAKQHNSTALAELTFYREKDVSALQRKIELPPQGFVVIDPERDSELKTFFEGGIGWCTIVTSNPYLTTFYFAESTAGFIGGDHGF